MLRRLKTRRGDTGLGKGKVVVTTGKMWCNSTTEGPEGIRIYLCRERKREGRTDRSSRARVRPCSILQWRLHSSSLPQQKKKSLRLSVVRKTKTDSAVDHSCKARIQSTGARGGRIAESGLVGPQFGRPPALCLPLLARSAKGGASFAVPTYDTTAQKLLHHDSPERNRLGENAFYTWCQWYESFQARSKLTGTLTRYLSKWSQCPRTLEEPQISYQRGARVVLPNPKARVLQDHNYSTPAAWAFLNNQANPS